MILKMEALEFQIFNILSCTEYDIDRLKNNLQNYLSDKCLLVDKK